MSKKESTEIKADESRTKPDMDQTYRNILAADISGYSESLITANKAFGDNCTMVIDYIWNSSAEDWENRAEKSIKVLNIQKDTVSENAYRTKKKLMRANAFN